MRLNFFGGPGCGKSHTAKKICLYLDEIGRSVEYIPEYVKSWAYQKRIPKSFDQVYLFSKQLYAEDQVLQNGVENIVTDSPILLAVAYTSRDNPHFSQHILGICQEFDKCWPSINIFLDRKNIPYKHTGRYETYEEAIEMDRMILNTLDNTGAEYKVIDTKDIDSTKSYISSNLS